MHLSLKWGRCKVMWWCKRHSWCRFYRLNLTVVVQVVEAVEEAGVVGGAMSGRGHWRDKRWQQLSCEDVHHWHTHRCRQEKPKGLKRFRRRLKKKRRQPKPKRRTKSAVKKSVQNMSQMKIRVSWRWSHAKAFWMKELRRLMDIWLFRYCHSKVWLISWKENLTISWNQERQEVEYLERKLGIAGGNTKKLKKEYEIINMGEMNTFLDDIVATMGETEFAAARGPNNEVA